jgi:hydrogenase maturation protease
MARPRILIAGVGNIFLGDDGFGSDVARRLARRALPDETRVIDFGVRGFDLAYALLDGYDVTILIDAMPRGGAPGTLYAIEPDLNELNDMAAEAALPEAHALDPLRILALARSMGGELKRLLLLGCEPLTLGPEGGQMGLSEPVMAAADEAVKMIESLVAEILEGRRRAAAQPS